MRGLSISQNVMEALKASWLLLLTFLNLTPERKRGGDQIPGSHWWKWQNHFHQFQLRVPSSCDVMMLLKCITALFNRLYIPSETSDQCKPWEASGERRRRRRVLLHCGSWKSCPWGQHLIILFDVFLILHLFFFLHSCPIVLCFF